MPPFTLKIMPLTARVQPLACFIYETKKAGLLMVFSIIECGPMLRSLQIRLCNPVKKSANINPAPDLTAAHAAAFMIKHVTIHGIITWAGQMRPLLNL
jgi:hypothetical protein